MYFDFAQYEQSLRSFQDLKQKGQGLILIIVGLVIVAAIAGGSYYFGRSSTPKLQNPVVTSPASTQRGEQTPQPTIIPVASPSATPDETANWKTYTNTKIKFSIRYPSELDFAVFEVTDGTLIGPPRTDTLLDLHYFYNPDKLSLYDAVNNLFIKAESKNNPHVEQGLQLLDNPL